MRSLCFTILLLLIGIASADNSALYQRLFHQIGEPRLRAQASILSEHRLAGSEGVEATISRCEEKFRTLGFRTSRETFDVTVPESTLATVTSGKRQFKLEPLWPNLVRTSQCDLTGQVIDGGTGTLEELSGKSVEGSIVILRFNSGVNWTNAGMLKAAAVLFVRPSDMTRSEAEEKFKASPLDLPRFLISLEDAEQLLQAKSTVRVQCDQGWHVRQATNLIADAPGSDPRLRNQPILVVTFADSMSVVPSRAPGAQQAGGLMAAMALAEVWAKEGHSRPLRILVSSAHCLSLEGAKHYIWTRFVKPDEVPLLVATLDLSTESEALGVFGRGYEYNYRDEALAAVQPIGRKLRQHAEELALQLGGVPPRTVLTDAINHSDNRTWRNNIPGSFALDCEPFTTAGYAAITFATIDDSKRHVDTPDDRLSSLNFVMLTRQTRVLNVLFHHLLNDPLDKLGVNTLPINPSSPSRLSLIGGFARAAGYIASFDPTRSLLPDSRISNSLAVNILGKKSLMGVRGNQVQLTQGPEARYEFVGLPTISDYATREKPPTVIVGYHLDPRTGKIDYAPDDGVFGFDVYPYLGELKVSERQSPVVLFPCVATNVFGLVDPQELVPLLSTQVIDPEGGGRPNSYGFSRSFFDATSATEVDDTGVIFTKPGQRIQLIAGNDTEPVRLLLLNSTQSNVEGSGYLLDGTSLGDISTLTARDLCVLNQSRVDRFSRYRMLPAGILEQHRSALAELDRAEEAREQKDWAGEKAHARAAWALAIRIHPILKQTANDAVNGVIFYSFLLIPFSYFVERLLFGRRSLGAQLLVGVLVFIASFALLRAIHPAFDLVSSPFMIFIGFVMGSLSVLVAAFILGKFESALREVKQNRTGIREIDLKRGNVAAAAISLGISNLRRRKARTVLTTLTLAVMTFIVLSFTSVVPEVRLSEVPSPNQASYPGLLLREPGLESLKLTSYRALANEFRTDSHLSRRVYTYGPDMMQGSAMTISANGKYADVSAVEGLDPAERYLTKPNRALISGDWFEEGDEQQAILPQSLASKLGVRLGDPISYMGESFTVRGIYDSGKMANITDLDGESILPPDFSLSRKAQSDSRSQTRAFRQFVRLDPSVCFFIPAEAALRLGGELRTLGVAFDSAERSASALSSLMPRLRMNLYGTVPGAKGPEVRQFSVMQGSKTSGLGLVVVQLAIASMFVLNTMIASVYERKREIAIFSAIGLSPSHISTLFFAESAVYGVLGAVLGYFAAQGVAKLLLLTGAFPALTLNFSSTSAIMATGLVLFVVIASSLYPAKKAAQIAAPARAEQALESEPEGDDWEIPLPFSVPAEEAAPIIRFLAEWFKAHEEYAIGSFVTAETSLQDREVTATAWLNPYDLGVSQKMILRAEPSQTVDAWKVTLKLRRLSGLPDNWVRVNKRFQAELRRQFLRWRTLNAEERARFEGEPSQSLGLFH